AEAFSGRGIDLMDLARAVLRHPERALGPRESGVDRDVGRRHGAHDVSGFRIDLSYDTFGQLVEVTSVERRTRGGDDAERAPRLARAWVERLQVIPCREPDVAAVEGDAGHVIAVPVGPVLALDRGDAPLALRCLRGHASDLPRTRQGDE